MIVKIGDVISEYSVRNKFDENIPVYSVTNEKGFCTGYFSKEVASKDKSTYKIVPRGYFAYNPSRINVGSVDWQKYEDRVIVSPLYVVFGVSDRLDRQYLLHYLKRDMMLSFIKEYATGSVRDNLKLADLGKLPINLRPVEEQRQIATTLDKIDDLIAKRRQQLDKLDELVKSRFIEMFGDPVSNPLGWEKRTLKEVCTKLNDGTHFSPESFETGKYKYVTAKNIKMSGFDFSNITYVSEEVHRPIYERCNPEMGDVLYIKDGVTTGIAMVNTLEEEFTLLSSVALLKQDRRIMNGYFLTGLLNNENMYIDIRSNMGGAAITRLTIAKLNTIKVILPPLKLQERFAVFIIRTDKSKLAIQKSLDKLEILKKALMQEYFG